MNIINDIVTRYENNTKLLNKLALFFNRNLLLDQKALDYCVINRGFNKKSIDSFIIGYNVRLQTFIDREQIDPEVLIKVGVLLKNDDGSYYDKFSNRIIFPFFDLKGDVVGFTGRLWKENIKKGKYIHSSLSTIYQKSLNIYGLYQALSSIVESNLVFIVEGNPDVITCHQEDIDITVSVNGTSFMEEHYLILRQFTNRFIFCFDADEGGEKGIEKIKELLNDEDDIEVGYLKLEGAKDPDEFINKFGSSFLKESILKLESKLSKGN